MPGKVNPVIPDVVADHLGRHLDHDLNVMIPMMGRNLLESIALLGSASRLLADKCVAGIRANEEMCNLHAEATLATATALNPHIGYDAASAIVKEATASGRTLREVAREHGVEEDLLREALNLHLIAQGNSADG